MKDLILAFIVAYTFVWMLPWKREREMLPLNALMFSLGWLIRKARGLFNGNVEPADASADRQI